MAARQLPDPELLRKLLRYDPATGKLYWLARTPDMFDPSCKNGSIVACATWNDENAGNEALAYEGEQGYLRGSLFGTSVRAHRVAWAIFYGEWPNSQIDHVNGNRGDNRIGNLRLASNGQNVSNRGLSKNNTTGFKGVSWHKRDRKWIASIKVDGRKRYLGSFDTPEKAHQAYCAASRQFHKEFGRTA